MVRTILLGFTLIVLAGCGGGNTATVSEEYTNSGSLDSVPAMPSGEGSGDDLQSPPPPSIDG